MSQYAAVGISFCLGLLIEAVLSLRPPELRIANRDPFILRGAAALYRAAVVAGLGLAIPSAGRNSPDGVIGGGQLWLLLAIAICGWYLGVLLLLSRSWLPGLFGSRRYHDSNLGGSLTTVFLWVVFLGSVCSLLAVVVTLGHWLLGLLLGWQLHLILFDYIGLIVGVVWVGAIMKLFRGISDALDPKTDE